MSNSYVGDYCSSNNIPAELVIVENGLHGLHLSKNQKPSYEEILQIIADFFAEKLK